MKDNFSRQADLYKKFRPVYPKELYDFILKPVPQRKLAWDCGTGNGQVAGRLANYFEKVYATDISKAQLSHAIQKENIIYQICPAEQTPFSDQIFDLITVAQAVHWFNFDLFNKEVVRVAKPGATLAIWGYGLLQIDAKIDPVIYHFYEDIMGSYWDPEREHINNQLESIPFPFSEIHTSKFAIRDTWTIARLIGFLNTWSSVQKYIQINNKNPVELIADELKSLWETEENKTVTFPVFLKTGKI